MNGWPMLLVCQCQDGQICLLCKILTLCVLVITAGVVVYLVKKKGPKK